MKRVTRSSTIGTNATAWHPSTPSSRTGRSFCLEQRDVTAVDLQMHILALCLLQTIQAVFKLSNGHQSEEWRISHLEPRCVTAQCILNLTTVEAASAQRPRAAFDDEMKARNS